MSQTDYSEDPDTRLMLAFQQGDKASFEQLMVKYYPRVLNFVYRYTNNKATAEDLTQEVFIRLYKTASRYQPKAKIQTFLFTIAKNLSLNELRKLKRKMVSLDETTETGEGVLQRQLPDPKAVSPSEEMARQEKAAGIRAAISELPENQRTAVLLRRYEQMSYDEIAVTMQTTAKAVKSLLNRAKENLRKKLKQLI